MLGLPDCFPFIVALTVALLLSTYCFGVVQKAALRECVVLIPLATVIIFSTALGTNNFIAHGRQGASQSEGISRLEQEEQHLLTHQKRPLDELPKVIGEQPEGEGSQQLDSGLLTPHGTAGGFTHLLGFLVSDAYGQEEPRRLRGGSNKEQQKSQEALRLSEQERQRLQEEERKLAQQRQDKQRQERRPLWKSW